MSYENDKGEMLKDSNYDLKKPYELIDVYKNTPEPIFYWRGIEDISFGVIFGPSKAGKTILSENLALSLAIGRNTFFKSKMIGQPKRTLIVNLEENYRNRARRLENQIQNLSEDEKDLLNNNLLISGPDFPRFLYEPSDWKGFLEKVKNVKPDILIIDSFTRIVNGDITNRDICKGVLAKLRAFAYDNSICLILIHHSTKLSGGFLTMDSMAGSSVISQEIDFSIGLNRNNVTNTRYLKEVFYRYKEANDLVLNYEISSETNWLLPKEYVYEANLVSDIGEKYSAYFEMIKDYLDAKANEILKNDNDILSFEIKSSELKNEFVQNSTIPSRSFDYTLRNIVKNNILKPKGPKGNYLYTIREEQLTQVTQQNDEE